jgi:histidinol dehydrogenase
VTVLADDTARPDYVAADMISQAEHDETNRVSCVTTSRKMAQRVWRELKEQITGAPRRAIVKKSLNDFGKIIVAKNLTEAVALCNELAPEHLEIMARNPRAVLSRIKNAGSIFLGHYAPVPLGDFFAGPNHILPTGTTARFYSPLGVYDFVKYSSVTEYSRAALVKNGKMVMRLAEAEEFGGHRNAVAIRLPGKKGK